MPIINNRSTLATDPLRNFRFLVTFIPQDTTNTQLGSAFKDVTMGFTSVSGLSVSTDSIPYREGGYNTTVHQIPGQTTFTPLTLQRGVMLGKNSNYEWMRQLFATISGAATTRAVNQNFRCDIDIQVLSHPIPAGGTTDAIPGTVVTPGTPPVGGVPATKDHVALRFRVYNAWPQVVAYSDLNAGDNALLVEQMVLVHEGFEINWAANLTTDASDQFPIPTTKK